MLPDLTHTAGLNIRLRWTQLSALPADILSSGQWFFSFLIHIEIERMQQKFLKNTMGVWHTTIDEWTEFKLATTDGTRLGNMIDVSQSCVPTLYCIQRRCSAGSPGG